MLANILHLCAFYTISSTKFCSWTLNRNTSTASPKQSSDQARAVAFQLFFILLVIICPFLLTTPTHTHTHAHPHTRLTALCPGLPGWAGNRKVKPIWILPKQETVSGSGISLAICKSAPRSRQITMPAPHRSVFYRPDALPATQPTASKHWRQICEKGKNY